jgi:2-methylfumaryl-CoA hydratase
VELDPRHKTNPGNFFEDFRLGQEIRHAVPRTVSAGDAALYIGLTGSRFALPSSDTFAQGLGLPRAPIANLGYADCRFGMPLYPGDTISARSSVIGLKENSNRETGIVYVKSEGRNQRGETVLSFVRWVMVRKRDIEAPAPEPHVPDLPARVAPGDLAIPSDLSLDGFDTILSGSPHLWDDYREGEKIDHVDGMTLEEADHMTATRLYQNNARVHFNQHAEAKGRFGRRLIYGGHVISIARALSCNGLGNAFKIAAINGGRHVGPSFAGDTIYAWSEIVEKSDLPGRKDLGALRLRTIAVKDQPCADFPGPDEKGKYPDCVLLDLDYTVLMKRR